MQNQYSINTRERDQLCSKRRRKRKIQLRRSLDAGALAGAPSPFINK
jgi:hypothetical protein